MFYTFLMFNKHITFNLNLVVRLLFGGIWYKSSKHIFIVNFVKHC